MFSVITTPVKSLVWTAGLTVFKYLQHIVDSASGHAQVYKS